MQTAETVLTDLMNHGLALSVPYRLIERGIIIFTLASSGNKKVELIIIPPSTFIPDHTHPDIDNVILPLFGRAEIRRLDEKKFINGYHGKGYPIDRGMLHGITTFDSPFVFLSSQILINTTENIEKNWAGPSL